MTRSRHSTALATLLALCWVGCQCGPDIDAADGGVSFDSGVSSDADAGAADAGLPDAGQPDAGAADSGAPDAGQPDAGAADSGVPDAGRADAGVDGGLSSLDGGLEVFITSMWYGGNLGGDGGAESGDFYCQLAARAALRPGTWRAWLGTSSAPARTRFTAGGPWYQSFDDGGVELVFSSLPTSTTVPVHPIVVNERRSTSFYYGPPLYWVGNTTTGSVATADTCLDFSDEESNAAMTGVGGASDLDWQQVGTKPCYWFNALLCFQQSLAPSAPTMGNAHKRVFITRAAYNGNMGGLAGADAKCQAAATDAGHSGTFTAYLGTTDAGAARRYVTGGPWYQDWADGGSQLTFANVENLATTPRVALKVDERGADRTLGCSYEECLFWTGTVGAYEPAWYTCDDWSNGQLQSFRQTPIGVTIADDPKWSNYHWQYCSYQQPLLCLER